MSIVQSLMAVIVVAIASISVAYPILFNTTRTQTSPAVVNGTPTATGSDATLLNNLPTIFLLGVFITIASTAV